MNIDNALWLRSGDSYYALPLEAVRYIIPRKDVKLQSVPTSKIPVWGLIAYNDFIIPVLKPDGLLPHANPESGYFVVYSLNEEWVAIWVDACIGFRQYDGSFLDLSHWRHSYET